MAFQPILQEIFEVDIVGSSDVMEIDLLIHEVPRERHRFGSLQTSGFNSEPRLGRTCFLITPRENSERLEQTVMIEAPIDYSRVISIPEQIVDPINTKCVTDDNFGQ